MLDGTEECRCVVDEQVSIRQENPLDVSGPCLVPQLRGGIGGHRHRRQPVQVKTDGVEIRSQFVEPGAAPLEVAGLRRAHCQRPAEGPDAGEPLGAALNYFHDFAQAPLVQPNVEEIACVERLGIRLPGFDAELVGVPGQVLGFLEPAGDAGAAREAELGITHGGRLA